MAVREYDRLRRSADDDRDRARELIKAVAGRRLLLHGLLLLGLTSWRAVKKVTHRACYGLLSNATGRMALALSALFVLLASGFSGESAWAYTGLWTVVLIAGAAAYGARAYYSREKWEESTREVVKAKVPGHSERYPPDLSFSRHRLIPLQEGRWVPHYDFSFRVPAELEAVDIYEVEGRIASALRVAKDTTYFLDWEHRQQTGRCYATAVPGLPDYIDYTTLWERLAELPGGAEAGPWKVPIAVSVSGVVLWDPKKVPHLLVGGPTGQGKSVAERSVLSWALRFQAGHVSPAAPPAWRILALDPKRIELSPLRPYANVEAVATEMDEMADVLDMAVLEMESRYKELERAPGHYGHIHELDPSRPLYLVVIDELAEVTAKSGGRSEEAKAADEYANRMSMSIELLTQKGRAAGIHLLMATQQPGITDGTMTSKMRMNTTGRLACGVMPASSSRMLLNDSDEGANPAQGGVKGRAVWLADAEMTRCQMVYTEWEHIYDQMEEMGYEHPLGGIA